MTVAPIREIDFSKGNGGAKLAARFSYAAMRPVIADWPATAAVRDRDGASVDFDRFKTVVGCPSVFNFPSQTARTFWIIQRFETFAELRAMKLMLGLRSESGNDSVGEWKVFCSNAE